MPFQPDQMSPESLRRLVKLQRRALAKVLGQTVPQHQAQEIVAQTLGYDTWHEALQRVSQAPSTPLTVLGDTHLMAADPEAYVAALRQAVRDGVQDVAHDRGVRRLRDLMVGDVVDTAAIHPEAASHVLRDRSRQVRPAFHARRFDEDAVLAPSDDLLHYHWPELTHHPIETVSSEIIEGVLRWATLAPRRLAGISFEDREKLVSRIRLDPRLAGLRDQMLEAAWGRLVKSNEPAVFGHAVAFIPGDQVWPWLHRAALQSRRDMMEAIYQGHERLIGKEPYCALDNAVFNRDTSQVKALIEAQCRRYGWSVDNLGGEHTGTKVPPRGATRPRSRP